MVDARAAARLSLLVACAILLLALSPLPLAGRLEDRAGALIAPVSRALHDATRPVAELLLHAGQVRDLSAENAELRRAVARLEAEAAALREANVAAGQTTALVAAVGSDASRYLSAAVVLRDPSPGRRMIVVDRGSEQGVAVGQPVLGPGATLVGTVAEVESRRSRVRLLSDTASAATAVVQASRVQAALVGTPGGLRLDFVPVGAAVEPGDIVLSSALGGRLPGGLLIGHVTSVRSRPQELFETVEVEPLTDYARLEQVLVLTDFTPTYTATDAPAAAREVAE